jgi:hypothetical protein
MTLYIHTYIHTHIHKYIHTYIYTYIYIHKCEGTGAGTRSPILQSRAGLLTLRRPRANRYLKRAFRESLKRAFREPSETLKRAFREP